MYDLDTLGIRVNNSLIWGIKNVFINKGLGDNEKNWVN